MDKNKFSDDQYVEQQLEYSWQKMGSLEKRYWQELLKYASQEDGLTSSLYVVIEADLDRVQQKMASTNNPSQKDKDYASRLIQLPDIDKTVKR